VWKEGLGAKVRGMEVGGQVGIESGISQAVGGRRSLLVEEPGVLLGSRETEGWEWRVWGVAGRLLRL